MRLVPLALICMTGLARGLGPYPSSAPSLHPRRCFDLRYQEGRRPGIGPDRIALDAGRDSGRAVWLPSPRQTAPHYVMVGREGRWTTRGDSLRVEFQTPYIQTRIELRRTGGTLRGRVGGMSDAAIGIWGWQPVEARRSACPSSSTSPAGQAPGRAAPRTGRSAIRTRR
ncbi:MAG TPA: hypothetical protein VFJ82_21750 [Longimicrobium sp.]|nr:hypothetical protein [Longimicrobium sp.]